MGARLAQVSRGAQRVSISLAVLKLMGIHQGAIFFSPEIPGWLAVPQPSTPSIVNGLCSTPAISLLQLGNCNTASADHAPT